MKLPANAFQPLSPSDKGCLESPAAAGTNFWQDVRSRFWRNKFARCGLALILFLILAALFGPFFLKFSYADQNLQFANQPPNLQHPLGTDGLGRDLLARVLYGARISLSIGIAASLINLSVGVFYGGIAGYYGGRIDHWMMRAVDILYSIPLLLYVILLMVVLKPGLTNIFIALGLVYWLGMARIVRGQILTLRSREYILAARLNGAPPLRILFRHLLPNSLGPIIVTTTLAIPEAIFTEAFLSFIGLGVSAPMASWGVLASEGVSSLRSHPFQLFFPAIAISLTMLAFNFVGDGLRDALDPRDRH